MMSTSQPDFGQIDRMLEQDRQWIAIELHDGLLQNVTGAKMQLEALVQRGLIAEGPARDVVVHAIELLRSASEEARKVVQGLQPIAVEEKGLIGAIKSLLATQSQPQPKIRFKADVAFRRLEPTLETGIFRMVQEAVTNIRRHSQAERAEVRIAQIADRLEITIRDSGIGFDPTQVDARCFGLKGIRERARLLGGSAQVDSQPGKGTRIAIRLPLSDSVEKSFTTIDRSDS